ncbi:MAG TPA: hypothetical protein ENN97_03095 [Phycisphaerales bacterium]|nr:hypothetical protein [Phycisphaerales bacterium]
MMTMHGLHLRHWHWPDRHTLSLHLRRLVHDPRFWAALVITVLVALMLILSFVVKPNNGMTPPPYGYPLYPYMW